MKEGITNDYKSHYKEAKYLLGWGTYKEKLYITEVLI